MKKTLTTLILSLIVLVTYSQDECKPDNYFYLGAGAGFSDKNVLVNLKAGYNTTVIGVEGSMIAHCDNRNAALLNGQLLKSFYNSNTRLTILAGLSYHITTFDKVGGTKTLPIVGFEWGKIMNYHDAVIYVRGQVSGDNFCLMVGLEGIFKSNKN